VDLAGDIGSPITVSNARVESEPCAAVTQQSGAASSAQVVLLAVGFVRYERSSAWAGTGTLAGVGVGVWVGIGIGVWVGIGAGTHLLPDPIDELGDFGKDARFSGAFSGTERDDADDRAAASQRTAGITHASGPSSWLTEDDGSRGLVSSPFSLSFRPSPNLTAHLLQLVSQGFGMSSDETPTGQSASLAAVIGSSGRQGGKPDISAAGCWSSQLQESDVVLELLRAVELGVNVDCGDGEISLASIVGLQVPFTNANSVRGRAPGTSEAVSGAEDPSAGDEGSTTNVLSAAPAHHSQRNLVRELAMTSWLSTDDVVTVLGSILFNFL